MANTCTHLIMLQTVLLTDRRKKRGVLGPLSASKPVTSPGSGDNFRRRRRRSRLTASRLFSRMRSIPSLAFTRAQGHGARVDIEPLTQARMKPPPPSADPRSFEGVPLIMG